MSHITYKIVQHDDGWAYTVNGVFSESFNTRAAALAAAKRAAAEVGYSSVEEFIAHCIENELQKLKLDEAEHQVADQLRGLGYIE